MEAFGRALVLEPYLATVVLGGTAVRLAGNDAQKSRVLPAIADGSMKLAFAHGERQARYDLTDVMTTAKRRGAAAGCSTARRASSRTATAPIRWWSAPAPPATATMPTASRCSWWIGNANGVARRGYTMRDGTARGRTVAERGAGRRRCGARRGRRGFPMIERVVEAGIAATAAEAVGAMEAMQAMTLEYLKTRQQFGQPIGRNQALQHRAAEMLMALEQGRSMAMLAAMTVDEPDAAERARNIAMAKVGIGQAARFVSQNAVQLHGGIGMTEEYAVGHYFRRVMVIEHTFGDTAHHLSRLARETA